MEELCGHSKTLKANQEVTFYDPIKKLVSVIKLLKCLCSASAEYVFSMSGSMGCTSMWSFMLNKGS